MEHIADMLSDGSLLAWCIGVITMLFSTTCAAFYAYIPDVDTPLYEHAYKRRRIRWLEVTTNLFFVLAHASSVSYAVFVTKNFTFAHEGIVVSLVPAFIILTPSLVGVFIGRLAFMKLHARKIV